MPNGQPFRGDAQEVSPDGGERYAPTAHLRDLGERAQVQNDGSISWQSQGHLNPDLVVSSSIMIFEPDGHELNDVDSGSLVWQAIISEIKRNGTGKPILPSSLVKTANKLADEHFRSSPQQFVLVTSLSVAELPAQRIRLRNCEISALNGRGRKYLFPHGLLRRQAYEPVASHYETTKYLTVKAKTHGRTVFAAIGHALEAFNILRGIWTLFATYGTQTLSYGSMTREPIGPIRLGPIHTLHKLDGSLATEYWWYEQNYAGDSKIFAPEDGWTKIERNRRAGMRVIASSGYSRDVERLLIRYAAALDSRDYDAVILQLWGILELVTDTVGAKYDETIERASWTWKNRKHAKEMLNYLRMRRNGYVHAARSDQRSDEAANMIKMFVDTLLIHLVFNDFDVATIKEYGAFLSLPTDFTTLRKRTRHLRCALRMRKPAD